MEIKFLKKDDALPSESQYSVMLEEWTEQRITMTVTFDKPLKVSTGTENDEMHIRIIKPEYFLSSETGEMIGDAASVPLIGKVFAEAMYSAGVVVTKPTWPKHASGRSSHQT